MIVPASLGACDASGCLGEVVVSQVVYGIAEGKCSVCGLEYASPIRLERAPEADFLDEKEQWWQR